MIGDDLVGGQVWLRWAATEDRPPSGTEEYLLVHDKSCLPAGLWSMVWTTGDVDTTPPMVNLYYLFRTLPELGC